MFNSLNIKNFKGFNKLDIPRLGRVNLCFGNNNVGKSTLLEALSLLASNGSSYQMYKILELRNDDLHVFARNEDTKTDEEIAAYLPLVYNRDKRILANDGISISSNDKNSILIKLVKLIETSETNDKGEIIEKTSVLEFNDDTNSQPNVGVPALIIKEGDSSYSAIQFTGGGALSSKIKSKLSPDLCKFKYVSGRLMQLDDIYELWKDISMTEMEEFVIQALQIIEPDITRFNIIQEPSRVRKQPFGFGKEYDSVPFVLMKSSGERLRLSTLGDGINRILQIVLSLINCKDGILLVDEIENGLHYTVQDKLWKIIDELSKQLNVQVFATTHSIDCINSFSKVMKDNEFIAMRLDKSKENMYAELYDNPELLRYAVSNNIEVR